MGTLPATLAVLMMNVRDEIRLSFGAEQVFRIDGQDHWSR